MDRDLEEKKLRRGRGSHIETSRPTSTSRATIKNRRGKKTISKNRKYQWRPEGESSIFEGHKKELNEKIRRGKRK